jgi:hypothetical protein
MKTIRSLLLWLIVSLHFFPLPVSATLGGTLLLKQSNNKVEVHFASGITPENCQSVLIHSAALCDTLLSLCFSANASEFYIAYGEETAQIETLTYFGSTSSAGYVEPVNFVALYDRADPIIRDTLMFYVMTKHSLFNTEAGDRLLRAYYPEINVPVYGNYVIEIALAAASDEKTFNMFKSVNWTGRTMWRVLFEHFAGNNFLPDSMAAELFRKFPHLYGFIPLLAALDYSVGSPHTVTYNLCSPTSRLNDSHVMTPNHRRFLNLFACEGIIDMSLSKSLVQISKLQARYLGELAMLEDSFGSLEGMSIVEIGGGYGGMAVTLQTVYTLAEYTIIDLAAVGRLQSRYVSEVDKKYQMDPELRSLAPPAVAAGTRANDLKLRVRTIAATSDANVSSDLLISFFSIAEQKRAEIDKYVMQYIANAKRGYLQLNYDEDYCENMKTPVEGATLFSGMYTVFELFKLVYSIHPSTVLLPSLAMYDPISFQYHRIIWGSPTYGGADRFNL